MDPGRRAGEETVQLSPAALEVLGWLADEIAVHRDAWVADLVDHIAAHVPVVSRDPALTGAITSAVRWSVPAIGSALREQWAPVEDYIPSATASGVIGRTFAQGHGELTDLIEVFRVGQAGFFRSLLDAITTRVREPELLTELLQYVFRRFNDWVDTSVGTSIKAYVAERESLRGGALARRLRIVAGILDGTLTDQHRASATLGLDLRGYQTAAVIWTEQGELPADFDFRAAHLARALAQ
ncbi:MAG: hypothetical protein ACREQ5_23165, partial [Candidatus Dormibacteria bacterium]